MSNWTHVASVFRIDGLNYDNDFWSENELDAIREKNSYEDFIKIIMDKAFGKELLWGDEHSVWEEANKHPEEFLPRGSEGSLHKSIWINPVRESLASFTVSIFGDLRDHYSADEIIEWFKEKCNLFWIRNAVITVSNEWLGAKSCTYVSENKFIDTNIE